MSGAAPDPLDRLETWAQGLVEARMVMRGSQVLALVEVARAAREADDLLRRLAEWDSLTLDAEGHGVSQGDAPHWRREIDRVRGELAALVRLKEVGDGRR